MDVAVNDSEFPINHKTTILLNNSLFNQADILEEFNHYKFLRPMKKKVSQILNRLYTRHSGSSKSTKHNNLDNKKLMKIHNISVCTNEIDSSPIDNIKMTGNTTLQHRIPLFAGILC